MNRHVTPTPTNQTDRPLATRTHCRNSEDTGADAGRENGRSWRGKSNASSLQIIGQ
jgi:hypothetical protein